jgi:[acyl-carrier-protein] S-malonyltransferase
VTPGRRIAFLFAGQGAEEPRMGLALSAAHGEARELLELAGDEAGVDARRLLARGGKQLERTAVLQPLMVAVALGAVRVLRGAGLVPDLVAGHSLGEVSAWSASGAVGPEDAVRLAALRGRLMASEASRHPGGMIALPESEPAEVEAALAVGRGRGAVELAARNGPREWTLSGEEGALAAIVGRFPARRLAVAGAWHSQAMRGAVEPLRLAARAVPRWPPQARFISAATGGVVTPERVPDLLAEQLASPARWCEVMQALDAAGVSDFVVAGPGRILRGLVRKNLGAQARVHLVSEPGDVERTMEALAR